MRMRKRNFADALYVGPDVELEEVLDFLWPDRVPGRHDFDTLHTKGGNRVLIPVVLLDAGGPELLRQQCISYVADKPCQWPILPVHEYRGGYMTATARVEVELGRQPYMTPDYEYIERPLTEVYRQRAVYEDGKQVDTRGWTEMVTGKYIRTKYKVLYVDRVKGFIIVDPLLRLEEPNA